MSGHSNVGSPPVSLCPRVQTASFPGRQWAATETPQPDPHEATALEPPPPRRHMWEAQSSRSGERPAQGAGPGVLHESPFPTTATQTGTSPAPRSWESRGEPSRAGAGRAGHGAQHLGRPPASPLCTPSGKAPAQAPGGGSEGRRPAEEAGQRGQGQGPSSGLRGWGPCGLWAEALRPGDPGLLGKTIVAYSVCSGAQGAEGSGVFSRHWKSSSP